MDIDSPPHPPPSNTNIEEVPPTPTSDLRTVPPIETQEDVKMDGTVDAPAPSGNESTPPKTSLRFKNPNLSLEMNGEGSAGPSRASTPNGSVTASGGGRASRRKSYVIHLYSTFRPPLSYVLNVCDTLCFTFLTFYSTLARTY
jgi:hypothetical protein